MCGVQFVSSWLTGCCSRWAGTILGALEEAVEGSTDGADDGNIEGEID
jgi:hypothetical protein